MGFRNLPLGSFVKEGWEKSFRPRKVLLLSTCRQHIFGLPCSAGSSMLPTIDLTPSLFLGERFSTRFGKVTRGDIVTLRSPQIPTRLLTKRVVGMENDTVTYISNPDEPDKQETIVVPKGHVWVQGDNVNNSKDSRNFGAVPYALIIHRPFWRVLPAKKLWTFLETLT